MDSERFLSSTSPESSVSGTHGLDFLLNSELDFGIVPLPYIEERLEEIKVR